MVELRPEEVLRGTDCLLAGTENPSAEAIAGVEPDDSALPAAIVRAFGRTSPITATDRAQPAAAGSVMGVKRLGLKGSLGARSWWRPVAVRAQHHR